MAANRPEQTRTVELELPVGAYARFQVTAPCGLASQTALIGDLDDPDTFYDRLRVTAGLLWFATGWVEYNVTHGLPDRATVIAVEVAAELCSDAPGYNPDWPSDITLWLNDRAVGMWTAPGDFGGQRGRLTPAWWDTRDTQYGLLKRWRVDASGSTLDGEPLSGLTVAELDVAGAPLMVVRFDVPPDARHAGGLNLFGRSFGNHAQEIVVRIDYLRT